MDLCLASLAIEESAAFIIMTVLYLGHPRTPIPQSIHTEYSIHL